MEVSKKKKQIFPGILLLFFLGIVCALVYKAQISEKLYRPIEYTMMTEHKATSEVVLSGEIPEMSEEFLCKVPDLKSLSVGLTGRNVIDGAKVDITLSDAETGEIYYHKEKTARELLDARKEGRVTFKLPEPLKDSENKRLVFAWQIRDAGTTAMVLTANYKQALVTSFTQKSTLGEDADAWLAKTYASANVIYTIKYGDNSFLKTAYALFCLALLAFAALCYWMLVIRRMEIEKCFLPMALVLGLIFQCLITPGGVPDEPGHLDTAYLYSNKILFVEDTGVPGTVYKRRCDVEMADMLTNGLESNSYYQLWTDTFRKAEDTELIPVSHVDSTNLVPGIVYIPAALGISAGRVLGLSAILTFQLGRICNLIVFLLLAWAAIRLIPFGKNILGMTALLPIALQQGASASYDAVVNGAILLFIALCFRQRRFRLRDFVLTAVFAVFFAMIKGGVYLPILLLLLPALKRTHFWKNTDCRKKMFCIAALAAAGVLLLILACIKSVPVVQAENTLTGDGALYTVSYLIHRPLKVLYLYWNTLMHEGAVLLQGLMGGILSWLDFRMSWIFELVFLGCMLLLVNTEGDRFDGGRKQKLLIAAACGISIALIMLSMLVGYTERTSDYIMGVQGRYFLPMLPALLFLTTNRMLRVEKRNCAGIWMTMLTTEILLILQVAAMAV